ncbi:hypothetical protein [Halorubrum vacuolatum]|uniref:Uncharacterized protein n=1 Tax=Halorubrum vacuolatum TaxID=63740 RepID=A0A238XQ11_HALVU|nr:hypothetical protein [Halorubrum vacuolatum]SNR60668.1 hypothetical protein SAMN06264855_1211 [Halorubrum vacuolatum]
MKDLIESAMMKAAEIENSKSVSNDIFGPPKFLYVGCGARGIDRVKSRLNLHKDAPHTESQNTQPVTVSEERALETLVTTVAVHSDETPQSEESDQIDIWVDDPEKLADVGIDIDCCFITGDLGDDSISADILTASAAVEDSLTIAFLTMSSDHRKQIDSRFHESLGTTVVIGDSLSELGTIESLSGPGHRSDGTV